MSGLGLTQGAEQKGVRLKILSPITDRPSETSAETFLDMFLISINKVVLGERISGVPSIAQRLTAALQLLLGSVCGEPKAR